MSISEAFGFREICKTNCPTCYFECLIKRYTLVFAAFDHSELIVTRLDALSANVRKLEEVQRKTLVECDALKQAMLKEVFG